MTDIVKRPTYDEWRLMALAAEDEVKRLQGVIDVIERIAGEFGEYPDPADALLAIEQVIRRTKGV